MDNINSSEYKYSFVTEVFMIIYQTVDQKVLKIGSWTKYYVLEFNSCTQFRNKTTYCILLQIKQLDANSLGIKVNKHSLIKITLTYLYQIKTSEEKCVLK